MRVLQKSSFTCQIRTICEVHREMYDLLDEMRREDQDDRKELLVCLLDEATTMAKRMSKKLFEYKFDVNGMFEKNPNYLKSLERRKQNVRSE